MNENLFKHINILPENIHIPSGDVAKKDLKSFCQGYEDAIDSAGGIDLQILGIGRSGHIGFNEPGSAKDSPTRRIHLDMITRKDAASDFFGEENVPEMAITMGVGTILKAREICLLSFGEHKAQVIRQTIEEDISPTIAASYLQEHSNAAIFIDEASAADLTRIDKPWVLGQCLWDDVLKRHAVIWLAQKLSKPILKLTDEDYAENGLVDLLHACDGSYGLNIEVFRRQMKTITGWPGGRKEKRRILIFSPHPDDDVICMGGTMKRLTEHGHEVHTAYMASGYLSVFDHVVSRYADFARDFNKIFALSAKESIKIEKHLEMFLTKKSPGDIDSTEVQSIKGLIRRSEAIDAAKYCGLDESRLHFLDMPFYNTGKVQKLLLGSGDFAAVKNLLEKVEPEIIFAAGDLSDPHGTHRLCMEAILTVLEEYKEEIPLWLYRGAWQACLSSS